MPLQTLQQLSSILQISLNNPIHPFSPIFPTQVTLHQPLHLRNIPNKPFILPQLNQLTPCSFDLTIKLHTHLMERSLDVLIVSLGKRGELVVEEFGLALVLTLSLFTLGEELLDG